MKTLVASLLLLLGSMLFRCLGQDVVITNEYWIEPNTNGLNMGTIGNPFFGNTQIAFDTVMSNLVYYSGGHVVIHLLPGTYRTAGYSAYYIGPYTTISGSSMETTIVQFALTNQLAGVLVGVNGAGNITIENLTVDCNGQNNYKINGVYLTGSFETVKRVKVINSIGNQNNGWEAFPVCMDETFGPTKDLIVEDCVVSNCLGNYGDAFAVAGGNSCILNCRAYLPSGLGLTNGWWAGINCAGFNNTKIIGNHIEGGVYGFYMDTYPGDGILLEGNTFHGQNYGIQFNNGSPLTNILVIGNIIQLGTNVAYYPNGGIALSGNTNAYSVQISQNIVEGNNTGRQDASLYIGGVIGGSIMDNTLDNRLGVIAWNSTNLWMYDNVDQYGNYAAFSTYTGWLSPTSPPNPVKVTQTSASTYNVSANNYFIGVQTTACTITLPNAQNVGSGKTYLIQDEGNSTTSIVINPQSGQLINGQTSESITQKYGEITLISDGSSNWYAH